MKQVKLLLMMAVFCFTAMTTYALPAAVSTEVSVSNNTTTITPAKKDLIAKFTAKVEKKVTNFVSHLPIKKADDSKFLVAIILALVLGGIGIHRVYLGGKPTLILFYLLLNILFGFGALLGLIDLIVMAIDGNTGKFDGNDKLFAAFGK